MPCCLFLLQLQIARATIANNLKERQIPPTLSVRTKAQESRHVGADLRGRF